MFDVDLRRDRFVKIWRVANERAQATAAVIRRAGGYTVKLAYLPKEGTPCSWNWQRDPHTLLTEREIVRSIVKIDRAFQAMPGVLLRVDFSPDSTRAEQVLRLMDHGLLDIAPGADVPDDDLLQDGCRS